MASKRKRSLSKKKKAAKRRLAGQRQVFKAAHQMDREFRYLLARDEEAVSDSESLLREP